MESFGGGALLSAIVFITILVLFLTVIGIVSYILMAAGLYKMAKNRFIENPWLAWIPVANLYMLGKLVGKLKIGSWEVPSPELVLPIGSVVMGMLTAIPVVGWAAPILYVVLYYFALFKLYNIYRPHQAKLYLVLSIVSTLILMPILPAVFIFIMRKDAPGVY